MCGSRASNGYGSAGNAKGPVGTLVAAGFCAGCALAVRRGEVAAQANVASAAVFNACLRVIISELFLVDLC